MKARSDALTEINYLLNSINAYTPQRGIDITQDTLSSDVCVILAHWDYEESYIEQYPGIRWIFRQWAELRKNNNNRNFITKINTWRVCILSFEPQEYFRTQEKINMLLDLDTVGYLQTPPGNLKDIETMIEKLSNIHFGNCNYEQLGGFLDEMNFYELLNDYLHKFSRKDYEGIDYFQARISNIPQTLRKDTRDALENFQSTFGDVGSDSFKQECRNLYEKVQRGWF